MAYQLLLLAKGCLDPPLHFVLGSELMVSNIEAISNTQRLPYEHEPKTHKSAMNFRGFLWPVNSHGEQFGAQWSHYSAGCCNLLPPRHSQASLRQEAAQKAGHRGYRGVSLHGTWGLRAMHRKKKKKKKGINALQPRMSKYFEIFAVCEVI